MQLLLTSELHKEIKFPTAAMFNPLNAELNPICHLLVLLGAHHILHVSRLRVNIGGKGLSVRLSEFQVIFERDLLHREYVQGVKK